MSDPILKTSSVFMQTCDRDPTDNEPTIDPQLFGQGFFMLWRNTETNDLFVLISSTNATDAESALLTWGKFGYESIIQPPSE